MDKDWVASKLHIPDKAVKRAIGGLQNEVFHIETKEGPLILRLNESSRRTKDQLQLEIDFIEHLYQKKIKASRPRQWNGSFIHDWEMENKRVQAVFFEKAKGTSIRILDDQFWGSGLFREWGKYIGQMHNAAQTFHHTDIEKKAVRSKDNPDPEGIKAQLEPEMHSWYTDQLNALIQHTVKEDTHHLIHHDFHQGNFMMNGYEIMSFDFDDCMTDWIMQDLAVSLYHGIWQGNSFRPGEKDLEAQIVNGLLEGYSSVHRLDDEMINQLFLFLNMRDAVLYPIFKEKWTGAPWQDAYMKQLKKRLVEGIPYLKRETVLKS
ncbi:phosphotransferase [Jeotgalibacillus sp. ET6]|uniref:phosphotransferase enzyme family protein n=1 Tax=Jeotgalibacillus sp. ET6 TaxID=3037260 RepID=UPI002418B700|nr:phosphotransferase [Jeotgalibacillus sp. ET6]MDG5473330.1 phosphotransferase [Jeotgalibacillus sp. ET6]